MTIKGRIRKLEERPPRAFEGGKSPAELIRERRRRRLAREYGLVFEETRLERRIDHGFRTIAEVLRRHFADVGNC
jgi:hypothetical protein